MRALLWRGMREFVGTGGSRRHGRDLPLFPCCRVLTPGACRFGGVEPLGDDVVVASRLDANPRLYGHQERNCIGFVHDNKNPRRTHAHLNSRLAAWQGQEKQLRIRG